MSDQFSFFQQIWDQLPSDSRQELLDHAQELLVKRDSGNDSEPTFIGLRWLGGLKDLRGQYTALELQKKALEWRDE